MADPMSLLHEAEGRGQQCIGSATAPRGDSFDCCTERYEIVVLLPNSELSLQMVIISAILMSVRFAL